MTAAYTLATMLLGIVFLMTTKPSLATSIMVMIVAFFLGLLVSLPLWRVAYMRARRAPASVRQVDEDPFLRKTLWTKRW